VSCHNTFGVKIAGKTTKSEACKIICFFSNGEFVAILSYVNNK